VRLRLSARGKDKAFRKGIKGHVDSLAEIINDIVRFEEEIQLKLFLELLSQQQNNSYS
jgi:hypothetical protein